MYGKITEEEKFNMETKRKNVDRALEETIQQAKKCLGSVEFVKYRQKCEQLKEHIVNRLILLSEGCEIGYYTQTSISLLSQLKVLRELITMVEHDASKPERQDGK